ncbi:MAG: hypothetical protein DI588_18705 [Flavobacterium johnsoniae]|nr:MAG: hypothetical protein DI588_18705 [Flavobacterium johnsoniae]
MKALKVRLFNSEQFKPAIKALKKMGYRLNGKPPHFAQYIYTSEDGVIMYDYFASTDKPHLSWSNDENPDSPLNYFKDCKSEELKINDLVAAI